MIAAMLAGCIGGSGIQPLNLHDTFTLSEKRYTVILDSDPVNPRGGEPFTLKIRLQNAETKSAVKHVTYELEIQDGSGKTVFWDSRHAMEGASYAQKVILESGDYTVRVALDHGMGDKIKRLYEKELKFRVG